MKILHVAQSLKGGPASYFDEIIPHQVKTYGPENISLVIPADDLQYLSAGTLAANVHTFPTRQRSIGSLARFAMRTLSALRQIQPDIAHFHSTFAGAIGRPLRPFGGSRPKVVYCAHGWSFDMEGGSKAPILAFVERLLAAGTDAIINISVADQQSAQRRGIGIGKNVTVPNGICDIARDGRPRPELQRQLGMDPNKINMLFVGRFDHQKGADIAMDTAALLPPDRYHLYAIGDFVVSGAAPDAMIAVNASRLGWMDRAAIAAYYEAADVLIMPSRWEGFGLVAIEAMRGATPVLAAAVGGLPGLVVDGITGALVPPGQAAPFAAVLGRTTKAQWHDMGIAARQHFLAHFTADRLNAGLDAVYRRLLLSPLATEAFP